MELPKLESRIMLEGPNGVGKTSIARILSQRLGAEVYAPFAGRKDIYELWFKDPNAAMSLSIDILESLPNVGIFDRYHLTPQTMINHPLSFLKLISDRDLLVSLDADIETLRGRLSSKNEPEDVDSEGFYKPHYYRLADNWNAMYLQTDNMTVNEIVELILNRYQDVISGKQHKIKEGRSKIVYRKCNNIIVELKPSLDSVTYHRSENVVGTELLRNSICEKFIRALQSNSIEVIDYNRLSSNSYSCDYCYSLPFEVIVKKTAVGTTITDCPGLFYPNMPFKKPIVRFDYRCDPKDITIPRDYIINYGLDPEQLENTSSNAFSVLQDLLKNAGYELIDLCFVYGFTLDGSIKIISEISPDGMRIRKDGQSYDKDLFRNGYGDDCIISNWEKLLEDLS